jgi:hypothetical protein
MTDLKTEELGEVERLAEPAGPCEGEMLGKNAAREGALEDKAAEGKNEEPILPKLSAAEFRAYNSMAEHMEYFVSPQSRPLLFVVGHFGDLI